MIPLSPIPRIVKLAITQYVKIYNPQWILKAKTLSRYPCPMIDIKNYESLITNTQNCIEIRQHHTNIVPQWCFYFYFILLFLVEVCRCTKSHIARITSTSWEQEGGDKRGGEWTIKWWHHSLQLIWRWRKALGWEDGLHPRLII